VHNSNGGCWRGNTRQNKARQNKFLGFGLCWAALKFLKICLEKF